MIVCSCNVLSDHDVRTAVTAQGGSRPTTGEVYGCLGCSPQCGRCVRTIKRIMDEALAVACRDCSAARATCAHPASVAGGQGNSSPSATRTAAQVILDVPRRAAKVRKARHLSSVTAAGAGE